MKVHPRQSSKLKATCWFYCNFPPCLALGANSSLGALRACTQTQAAQTHQAGEASLPVPFNIVCAGMLVLLHKTC